MKKETLYKFFEGLASLEEEKQIHVWMEASPENEQTLYKERKLFDAITLLAQTNDKKNSSRQRSLVMEWLKIAAAVFVTIALGALYMNYRESPAPVAMQSVTVPAGQRVSISLPDGTNVWLNARSELKYPVSFNQKERRLYLDGEAYFEVKEDKGKPFIVSAGQGSVEALGTAFNLEAYSEKGDFETTVMSGRVKVASADNKEAVYLSSDNKASLKGDRFTIEKVDDYIEYRWIEGLICFKNEPFADIMKTFEKYYGAIIEVRNQEVQKYTYTGKFRHTDGIDYALRVLQRDIYFTFSRDDENHIIYIE
ncbi:MAG: FecR domain-containing protein [Tannerellaceae bacterium]|jgi:ferric-dicitrate binding protein FerR (iron transport regulator)|nr:FecR domain-containing protein [Tannerellaceae bacterium]